MGNARRTFLELVVAGSLLLLITPRIPAATNFLVGYDPEGGAVAQQTYDAQVARLPQVRACLSELEALGKMKPARFSHTEPPKLRIAIR